MRRGGVRAALAQEWGKASESTVDRKSPEVAFVRLKRSYSLVRKPRESLLIEDRKPLSWRTSIHLSLGYDGLQEIGNRTGYERERDRIEIEIT